MDESPLRILHIIDHSLPLHSGYTFRTQSILHQQKKRGWTPVAVTSPKHQASWKGPVHDKEEIAGVAYYRTAGFRSRSLPLTDEIGLMMSLASRIEQVVRIEKPDILHAHSPVLTALPALWIGRKLGLPVVYEIRAFWEDAAVDHGTYAAGSWKYRAVRSLETWACRRATQVAVLCNGLKADLLKRGIPGEKITVVFNGIDPAEFKPCDADIEFARTLGILNNRVVGFVGSFYRYEGLDLLVRAVHILCKTRTNLTLLLVGGGETEGDLRKQVEEIGLKKQVIFPGRLPHEKIPGVYALMDILVYPRYSMRLTELVTPLKPLEAMAMGKALVASDIGGHRELIYDGLTGLLFKPGDLCSLTEKIGSLLDDSMLRGKLASQGRDWVCQHHSWETTTSVYSSIYSRALEARQSWREVGNGTVTRNSE